MAINNEMHGHPAGVSSGNGTASFAVGGGVLKLMKIDGRSRAARRIREVRAAFAAALGETDGISVIKRMQIGTAAELAVAAEVARNNLLAGSSTVSLDDLVRLERRADAAARALGLAERNGSKAA